VDVLRRDKDFFERLIKERTRDLLETNRELERTRRLSDIGMLAATVAHELRNPLAAIQMAVYNVKKKADLPIHNRLTTIEKKVAESSQIIDNLLFYSRLKRPVFKTINVYDQIKDSVNNFKLRYPHVAVIDAGLDGIKETAIEADPVQLKEVLSNILNNAADAVRFLQDNGRIEVSATQNEESVSIFIRDNGEGMSKEALEKATEPFYTTKAKGTGLGLTVSRQIVAMHGGTLQLESEPGKGTTVILCLPRERAA
jgi:signal transduction histidine kinase